MILSIVARYDFWAPELIVYIKQNPKMNNLKLILFIVSDFYTQDSKNNNEDFGIINYFLMQINRNYGK